MIKSLIQKELSRLDKEANGKPRSWGITTDGIKRPVVKPDGKTTFQRFPKKLYRGLNEKECLELLEILNFETSRESKARHQFDVKTSYLPPEVMKGFADLLISEIPKQREAKKKYNYLVKYFIDYFTKLEPNPVIWHRNHVPGWTKWLEKQDLAVETLKAILQTVNRFMMYLHKTLPDHYPAIKFEPITKARFRAIKSAKPPKSRNYVTDAHHKILMKRLEPELLSLYALLYHYGLRLGEACFFHGNLQNIKRGYIFVEKQLLAVDVNGKKKDGPPKHYKTRKTPHWLATVEQCHAWAKALDLRNPTEYGRRLSNSIEKLLGFRYTPHDCRHTFITRAVRTKPINDVRLAVGHEDLKTLEGYLKDDRLLDDDVFDPG